MQFTTAPQKAYLLEANGIGMNTVQNKQCFVLFLNLEKQQNTIKTYLDGKETTNQAECIKEFYKTLFKQRKIITTAETDIPKSYHHSKPL